MSRRSARLVLGWRDLVVAGLDRNAQFAHLQLGLEHEGQHPLGDRAEVVVVELVAFRRLGAEQGAPGGDQVGALEVVLLVDQEVLLLGADRGEDALALLVAEQPQRLDRRARERVHRAQQRDLRVERLAGPGGEGGRDAEQDAVRVLEQEGGGGRVPGGVAARLEGGADAAGREGGGVGLALDQLLAGEAGQRRCLRRRARRRSRASPRSSRSAAGTCACSGSRRSPAPIPSSPRRPRRRGSGRAPRRRRGSPAASRRRRQAAVRAARRRRRRWRRRVVLGQGQVDRAEGLPVGAPLRCGHVLLANTSHRFVSPSLASPVRGRVSIAAQLPYQRAKAA